MPTVEELKIFEKVPELAKVEKTPQDNRRGIKTFVIRGQKLREYQIKALENYYYDYCISFSEEKLDFRKIFGNDNPVVIEIGFGMGVTTVKIAEQNPNINYIGIEVFLYGFSKVLNEIHEKDLKNVRLMRFDATEVLSDMIADNSVYGFHIFFPDPWPKKRHHRRRLIQKPLAELLASKLQKDGYIYCVTDWQEYADQMLEVFSQIPLLKNPYDGFAPAASWRPQTNFERKGLDKDYTINEVWVEKKC